MSSKQFGVYVSVENGASAVMGLLTGYLIEGGFFTRDAAEVAARGYRADGLRVTVRAQR